MSTYVLMKILESAPHRYDKGIRILTLGRLDEAYDRLISYIEEGQQVIDLGCGTGGLTLRAAQKGAKVKGIDVNPQMLEIAQRRAEAAGLGPQIELCEMGVAELGSEPADKYDAVMSGLCFSELTEDEQRFALNQAKRILKPKGLLLIADEVKPDNFGKQVLTKCLRFPLIVLTYLLAQTATKPVKDLPQKVNAAGFVIQSIHTNRMETFVELVARKTAS